MSVIVHPGHFYDFPTDGYLVLSLITEPAVFRDGVARLLPLENSGYFGSGKRPILICAHNGLNYVDAAFAFLKSGGDTLDAAIRVVKGPEDDPNDDTVGLGGLPNEDGVVELDACCMHGPTRRAGSVGGVRNIKNVALVSKAVMEHTGHVMLVGEGAERFAVAKVSRAKTCSPSARARSGCCGRKITRPTTGGAPDWPIRTGSSRDSNGESPQSELWQDRIDSASKSAAQLGIEPEFRMAAMRRVLSPPTGTIHCSALNDKGEMSGVTTTSGLSFKIPGRVRRFSHHRRGLLHRSGCGFGRRDRQRAKRTSRSRARIPSSRTCGAACLRIDAGMDALKRIVRNYNNDMTKLKFIDMTYYILRKDGAYAGVSLWEGYSEAEKHKIIVHDGVKRAEVTVALLKGTSHDFPPFPIEKPKDLTKDSEYLK
jgi:N4-(beta-N-acetylglucosaminyl)-L-asparaginase